MTTTTLSHTIPLGTRVSETVRQKVLASINEELGLDRPRRGIAGVALFVCGVLAGLLLAVFYSS